MIYSIWYLLQTAVDHQKRESDGQDVDIDEMQVPGDHERATRKPRHGGENEDILHPLAGREALEQEHPALLQVVLKYTTKFIKGP